MLATIKNSSVNDDIHTYTTSFTLKSWKILHQKNQNAFKHKLGEAEIKKTLNQFFNSGLMKEKCALGDPTFTTKLYMKKIIIIKYKCNFTQPPNELTKPHISFSLYPTMHSKFNKVSISHSSCNFLPSILASKTTSYNSSSIHSGYFRIINAYTLRVLVLKLSGTI